MGDRPSENTASEEFPNRIAGYQPSGAPEESLDPCPVTLILHNIRSTYNVGAILRTAEGFGVEKVICSGYTPWPYRKSVKNPENPGFFTLGAPRPGILPHLAEKLQHQIHKSALGAEEMLEIEWSDDVWRTLWSLRQTHQVIGLENRIEQRTAKTTDPKLGGLLRPPLALLLGEEVSGIPPKLYPTVDFFLEIPMYGRKESFNVSVAAALALSALKNCRGLVDFSRLTPTSPSPSQNPQLTL